MKLSVRRADDFPCSANLAWVVAHNIVCPIDPRPYSRLGRA